MADLTEAKVREIVRDELSVKQVPERLASIEVKLEQKADKADIEGLKGDMKAFEERMTGKMEGLEEKMTGNLKTLEERMTGKMETQKAEIVTKQDALRDLNKSNFRIIITILFAILAVLIKSTFFPK